MQVISAPPIGYSLYGLGAEESAVDVVKPPMTPAAIFWTLLATAGTAISVYHGYKRNNGSIGWAAVWGIAGALVPVVTVPVAIAQGLGKRKSGGGD